MHYQPQHLLVKTTLLTLLALIAFAANSVLCRLALQDNTIDAGSFTVIRLLSGAIVLLFIISLSTYSTKPMTKGSWSASLMLFVYASTFSYAYLFLEAATGALILFASVQITMILYAQWYGNRLHFLEWLGIFIAFFGFIYLILPGVTAPDLEGLILMIVAGIAWAIYSIKGQSSEHALFDTGYNFIRTLPFIAVLALFSFVDAYYSYQGIILAIVSGGLTSAIGYTIWYYALAGLSAVQAAVVQLAVPIITALGGIIFLAETISLRLSIASILILGGILIVILGRYYLAQISRN